MTSTDNQTEKNREKCKCIAECLDIIADGRAYKAPDTGEIVYLDEGEEAPEDYEQADMLDYFGDVYDVRYIVGQDRELRGLQLLVAFGGPNIWVDTMSESVALFWWGDNASYPLGSEAIREIESMGEELWEMEA